ncbi:unnamed protein product [Scytosiphon promiscuus]
MASKRRVRTKICDYSPSLRGGLRSSSRRRQGDCEVDLPHHIILEVLSFLDTQTIVRGRRLSRAFRTDAPAMVRTLAFRKGMKFPSARRMKDFSNVKQVQLDGHKRLVNAAAAGLRGAPSLRRLDICLENSIPQQAPLSKTATKNLCALPLAELKMRRVEMVFPAQLHMPAWRTLETLMIRDGFICDSSLVNLIESIPPGPLPMRHLDLSRNLFGEVKGMEPFANALWAFPDLRTLYLTADCISGDGAKLVLRALLDGACPKLTDLDLSLNFLDDSVLNYLAERLMREGHGLQNLRRLGIGARYDPLEPGVTCFHKIGCALTAGGLPLLDLLHVQGDVGPQHVSQLLRKLKLGVCPRLEVLKVERPSHFDPAEDPDFEEDATEDSVSSMLELVTSPCVPRLRQVHVVGMNISKGLERAEEERTEFIRAPEQSSIHRLAKAGSRRGVMVFL